MSLGKIKENIETLKLGPPATDRTSIKIQTLAMLGFELEVGAALELTRESPLCTTLVEQCHGSGAQLMKRHQQLEHEARMARLTVHNCRTWFHQAFLEKQELKFLGMSDDLLNQDAHCPPDD